MLRKDFAENKKLQKNRRIFSSRLFGMANHNPRGKSANF